MPDDTENIAKKIEKKNTDIFRNINPVIIIVAVILVIAVLLYAKFSRNQMIAFVIALIVIALLLQSRSVGRHFLTEPEAWDIAESLLIRRQRIRHIDPRAVIKKGLPSSLMWINREQREYELPFHIIMPKQLPILMVARVDVWSGNTTFYINERGFKGDEKANTRVILPEDFRILQSLGLERMFFGRR